MKTRYPDLSKIRKILVAKLRHHGDVLMSTPVFHVLRHTFPDASIDAYIYKETSPILAGHPAIANLICYDRAWKDLSLFQRYRREVKLLRYIRRQKYDLVINLTEGDRGALAALASAAPLRIGFDPEAKGMWGKGRCYSHVAKNCHRPRHAVERNIDVLRCLGIFPDEEMRQLFFPIPQSALRTVQNILGEIPYHTDKYIVVHPVSRWLFKCLPPKTIAEAISSLQEQGKTVILTGSSDAEEIKMNQQIMQLSRQKSLIDLSGRIDLKEFGALLRGAQALITVDSLPLHMASALKTPVVAIFGPTSEETWAPWQHPHSEVLSAKISCRPCYMAGCGGSYRSDCLAKISAKEIVRAVHNLCTKVENLPQSRSCALAHRS